MQDGAIRRRNLDPRRTTPDFEGVTTAIAADTLDRLGLRFQAMISEIRAVGASTPFFGRAVPGVFEPVAPREVDENPYEGEMRLIDGLEPGDVPVLVQSPLAPAAAWGELWSSAAIGRGARGVVVDGLIRDSQLCQELGFPVWARGRSPLDTKGRAKITQIGGKVICGGVGVEFGDVILVDQDGVVIVPRRVAEEVASGAREKIALETKARSDLLAGESILKVWEKYRVF